MPELDPVGDAEPSEPVTIPIIGHDAKGDTVTTKIRFWGEPPIGSHQDMIRAIRPDGQILSTPARDYVEQCVLPVDREKWDELIHGTKVLVEQATLLGLYSSLVTYYTERPTKQRSALRPGRSSTAKTLRAAASATKSTSRRSA